MTVEQAIRTSIEYENRVRDLYASAARLAGHLGGRQFFKLMAEEEQHHVDYLEAKLKEWRGSGTVTWDGLHTAVPSSQAIEADVAKLEGTITGEGTGSEMDLLERAHAAEVETSDFYRRMVSELPAAARSLFSRFLEIEDGHLAIVRAQLDLLAGTGYWFDVREFNLEG